MLDRLIRLAPAQYRDLAKVMGGNLGRNFLRGIFKLLVIGALAPAAFGVYRSVFALFRLMYSVVDLGIDYALVTFVSRAISRGDDAERGQMLRTSLAIKVAVSLLVAVVGIAFGERIAILALGDAKYTNWVCLVSLCVSGQLLYGFLNSILTAHQRFSRLAGYLMTMPLLLILGGLVLLWLGEFTLTPTLVLVLVAPAATVLLWWPFVAREILQRPLWNTSFVRRVVSFSKWIYLTDVASANRNHLPLLMLNNPGLSGSALDGELRAGLYGFGNDLASEITTLSGSLITVLLPKVSGLTEPAQFRKFLRKAYRHLLWLVLAMIPLIFVVPPLLHLLGHVSKNFLDYLPALEVFNLLYLGCLLSVVAIPMKAVIYSMRVPQIETYLELAGTVVLVVGSILLIPRYGAPGAAWMVLAQRSMFTVLLAYFGMRHLRRLEGGHRA